ncbi:MAG TPA: MurT ligase domain-containing protein [Candidatus Saccharimonadales bacterium]|nr:MurT ligase domain-containing protein [Candidatus Saccharimonadales bacterium]
MTYLMTLVGKAIMLALRLLGRKGSALPGLVIEKTYPHYLTVMLQRIPRGVIVVTGTNGKTTTTKIIKALLESQGLRVLSNSTGSNFVRGIMATIAREASVWGKLPYDIAVFEQDEAHAVHFVKQHQPIGVVALNVTRDQMDRFGEIDTTAKLIGKVVAAAQDWVVLNANDPRVAALAQDADKRHVTWFGHTEKLQHLFPSDDQLHAEKTEFYEAATPDVCLTATQGEKVDITVQGNEYKLTTKLDGTHNALNIAAALAAFVAQLPEGDIATAAGAIESLEPPFGRGETVTFKNGATVRLQLVKNPAGFRRSLEVVQHGSYDVIGIAINDDYADGRDVSWLWDVDFTTLKDAPIATGGTRSADMALRLKYDDVVTADVIPSLEKFLDHLGQPGTQAIIFCTYTAMLRARALLKKEDKTLAKDGV